VDARSFQEWGETKIGNATWISVESVLAEGRLRAGDDLLGTFARLEMSRPVVVYSDDICEASVVWFALRVMGYDARVYRLEEGE
jgi:thiosulfate/3-mercaptopyruvate sulfurtransferase